MKTTDSSKERDTCPISTAGTTPYSRSRAPAMYKPAPLDLSRSYRSRHPEAWPRLYSPNTGSNRADRRLPAWITAAAGLVLVLVAEFGPDLVASLIFGG